MSRWKAAVLHLGTSVLVISTLGVLLSLTWYPPAYIWAIDGVGLIAIMAGVDVCLGPLLTLIVWNINKPSLRFDMAVIIMLQLAGLGYGLHAVYLARPVYMVFAIDRFDLVSATDIPEGELEKAKREEFKALPLDGPKIIAAQKPTERAERNRLLFSALAGGADLPQIPQYYVPYSEAITEVVSKSLPLDRLMQRDKHSQNTLSSYIDKHALDRESIRFLPLRAKRDQTVLIDANTAKILGIVDLDPW